MNGISLFAGIGGLDLGLKQATGIRTACYVEWDPYCQEVLKKRMQEGWLDVAPIYSDIKTFDGKPWRGRVDIVFGGFPCQDISIAGKGAGIKVGTRSGLFYELIRVVGEVRPRFVFLENVSMLTNRGIDTVLGELAKEGYDARWEIVSAAQLGAPHRRERWFCLGTLSDSTSIGQEHEICPGRNAAELCGEISNAEGSECESPINSWRGRNGPTNSGMLPYPPEPGLEGQESESELRRREPGLFTECDWLTDPADLESSSESFVGRVAYGIPKRVDRLKCLGNAVVPLQAAEAWRKLTENLSDPASLRGGGATKEIRGQD
jgi:DNA (cytosine-5)-methyltransferase 1